MGKANRRERKKRGATPRRHGGGSARHASAAQRKEIRAAKDSVRQRQSGADAGLGPDAAKCRVYVRDLNQRGQGVAQRAETPLSEDAAAVAAVLADCAQPEAAPREKRAAYGKKTKSEKILFVDGALPGDELLCRIQKQGRSYDRAVVEQYLNENPARRAPFCPVYERCGGCNLQHMDYASSLAWKRRHVIDCFLRIGGLAEAEALCEPCIGMDENGAAEEQIQRYKAQLSSLSGLQAEAQTTFPGRGLFYRNKVAYAVGEEPGTGALRLGFYASGTHELIHSPYCAIQPPVFDLIRHFLEDFARRHGWRAYDEQSGTGFLRRVLLRHSPKRRTLLLCLSFAETCPDGELRQVWEGVQGLLREFCPEDRLASFWVSEHRQKNNRILGESLRLYAGEEALCEELDGLEFSLAPEAFFQVNARQTERLYRAGIEALAPQAHETAFDLYCGTGTIALLLARYVREVVGVEIVPAAIENAKANAERNGLSHVHFFCGKAEEIVPELARTGRFHPDLVVLDPPRKGAEESLLRCILEAEPERILYISCHPASLARDAALLTEEKYRLKRLIPVDMFPWTTHVETVCLMTRVG